MKELACVIRNHTIRNKSAFRKDAEQIEALIPVLELGSNKHCTHFSGKAESLAVL